ncbi:MAG: ZIP family metal transporter [Candidatus Zixiibacteriota bacterium]|nr:MAG: ZIP family metal transporter [candidate division Zixibacteria bacterium]
MNVDLLIYSAILFLAAVSGGLLVLVRRWSDEHLHFFLSLGAGIFLGAVFIHLLPESMEAENPKLIGFLVLAGFLLLFFVERFLLSRGDGGYDFGHQVIGLTALIGLSIHAIIDGLGLALASEDPTHGSVLVISILAHKVPAAFALVSLLRLAKLPLSRLYACLGLFSIMTPLGALLLAPLIPNGEREIMVQITGIVTGSFLYIATCELLPEVFHGRHRQWIKLGLLLAGIAVISYIGSEFSHAH